MITEEKIAEIIDDRFENKFKPLLERSHMETAKTVSAYGDSVNKLVSKKDSYIQRIFRSDFGSTVAIIGIIAGIVTGFDSLKSQGELMNQKFDLTITPIQTMLQSHTTSINELQNSVSTLQGEVSNHGKVDKASFTGDGFNYIMSTSTK